MKPRKIMLAPVDLVFTGREGYSVECLLRFPYALDEKRLTQAVQHTTRKFFPINGRLIPNAQSGYLVEENAAGIDFQILPSLTNLDFRSPQDVAVFSQPIHSIPGESLARLRYTQVGTGSALGLHVSHCLVDGYSYFFFLGALAAAYRTSKLAFWQNIRWALLRPDFDRAKLIPAQVNTTTSPHLHGVDAEDVFRRTGLTVAEPRCFPALRDSQWEFIEFTEANLQALLSEASKTCERRLSRHDVLTARLWKLTAEKWRSPDRHLSCTSAFDYRRLHAKLSPLFFGNAVRTTAASLDREDIIAMPLGKLAEQIRQATDAINEVAANDSLSCLAEIYRLHGLEPFANFHVSHPQHGLLVTNLSRIPMTQLDFGGGPPEEIVPLTPAPRVAIVLAAKDGVVVRLQGTK